MFFLLFLIACFFVQLQAQTLVQPISARYLYLGAYSSQKMDIYAARANPASLANLPQASVAVYGEKRYMLDALNLYSASVGLPTSSGNFAFHGSYFGFSQSNQTELSLAYGRKLSNKIQAGAGFQYHQLSQAGIYGNASTIAASVGLMLNLTDKINVGVSAINPFRASFGKDKISRLAAQYRMGIGFDASDKLMITAEMVKEGNVPLNVNAGFQYQFIPQFFFRGGMATYTANYFAGFGFLLKDFRFDISTSYHPQLGWSPGILLLYKWGKNKQDPATAQP